MSIDRPMTTVPAAALMRKSAQPDDSVAAPATRSPAIAESNTFRDRVFIADLLSNRNRPRLSGAHPAGCDAEPANGAEEPDIPVVSAAGVLSIDVLAGRRRRVPATGDQANWPLRSAPPAPFSTSRNCFANTEPIA